MINDQVVCLTDRWCVCLSVQSGVYWNDTGVYTTCSIQVSVGNNVLAIKVLNKQSPEDGEG